MSAGLEGDLSGDEAFTSRFPIHRACRDGDVGALVPLLQQPLSQAYLTVEDSCYGWTPIHWAAHHGQLECVVRLVQMGCEVNTATSRFSQTPTHTAAFGGHPNCVVWLTQAGADVNRQDFVGEAPIHKAARSGSLECIQVLLIAGAKPHLVNASGQTAADLASTHGFHDCFNLISKAQKHLLQHGNGTPSTQELLSRKRLLTVADTSLMKKARRADSMSSGGEEMESMRTESAQEENQDDVKASIDSLHQPSHRPSQDMPSPPKPLPPPSSPQRPFSDMCGSLHLVGSPSSCMSHRPAWRGALAASGDCGDFLHYGHYHGFGDTAEELSDCCGAQGVERQGAASSIHLYHGS